MGILGETLGLTSAEARRRLEASGLGLATYLLVVEAVKRRLFARRGL